MRELRWTALSLASYVEEQKYILTKWNLAEVKKFTKLVEKSIKQIHKTINEGATVNFTPRKTVISKQTTLCF